VLTQRFDKGGAAGSVYRPHPPLVPVESAGLQQVGQRDLVEGGRSSVAVELLPADPPGQGGRGEYPAQPHGGGEGLTDGGDAHHPVRRQPLQAPTSCLS
jgi:hypothetical protein